MPVSAELRDEIQRAAGAFGAAFLDEDGAAPIAERVARRHVNDRSRRWWWESIEQPTLIADYGSADGLATIRSWLEPRTDWLELVVTDDQSPPWIGLEGSRDSVLEAIGDVWLCEFFVTTPDAEWVLFDTHHNLLILAGPS